MENKHVLDQLPAYAIGALDQDEKEIVDTHLLECIQCRDELERYSSVVQDLALASFEHKPPASLKRLIMDQAGRPTARENNIGRDSFWQRVWSGWRRISPAWGIASLALILLLLVSNLFLVGRLNQSQPIHQFQFVAMTGSEVHPGANGVLVVGSDGYEGALVVEHLPELELDSQYQLWLIKDGVRTNGGVFSVSADGYGYLEVNSAELLLGYDAFGVTVEPYGGSPGPTGEKVLGSG